MEVILGKSAGFCYGVRMAVEGAKEELEKIRKKEKDEEKSQKEKEKNTPLYCLGEIVHNKQVINDLRKKGLIFIDNIEESNGKTIIRAHGIKKEIYEIAKKRNIDLKDFTCPNVLKIHKIAEEYAKKGYYIFLVGSKNHPENIGTLSFCGNNVSVIEDENDVLSVIKELKNSGIKKLLVIIQTTYSVERFKIIENKIKEQLEKYKKQDGEEIELIIKNTICNATEFRQKETEEIAKKVDYMIIIGGKNSSNTKKLYEVGKKYCENCVCVETADELDLEKIEEHKKVGVMAGASTPKEIIDEVISCFLGRGKKTVYLINCC